MPTIRVMTVALVATLALMPAARAAAQPATTAGVTPTFELGAGYQWLHVPDQNFPFGIAIDGVRHFGPLGAAAEIGWARSSDDEGGVDTSTNMWHFAAGPRWTRFTSGKIWPYAQALVGLAVAHDTVEVSGNDVSDTNTAFMIQPGVGVTYIAGDGWGLFGQVDYRRTFFDEPDDTDNSINNQFRIYVGARLLLD